MTEPKVELSAMFLQLVMSLEAATMQQLGKIQSPFTGKVERNLELAKNSIDMLEMIERKTSGNLTNEEDSILKRVLFQLRMNPHSRRASDRRAGGLCGRGRPPCPACLCLRAW